MQTYRPTVDTLPVTVRSGKRWRIRNPWVSRTGDGWRVLSFVFRILNSCSKLLNFYCILHNPCWVIVFYIFGTTAKEMKPPFLIVYFMTLLDDLRKTGLEMQIMLLHSGSKNGKNISVLTIFEITCTYIFNSSELKF